MKLLNFIEHNDWEGETWNFYFFASEGDEVKLRKIIEDLNSNDGYYELEKNEYSVETVQRLLKKKSRTGYLFEHNFCGVLDLSNFKPKDDPFYKGGFMNFCKIKEL